MASSVPEYWYLTLLAGQAHSGDGGRVVGCTFPNKPGKDEASGGLRARVGNALHYAVSQRLVT